MASSASMPAAPVAPAMTDGEAVADVDGDGDPRRRHGRRPGAGEGRVAERGRPDDGARRPGREDRRDRILGPQPTGDLDRDVAPRRLRRSRG